MRQRFGATTNQTIQIGTVVRPGQSYTFSETLKAPAENGTYNPQFRMVWEDHQMFGAPINKTVTVVNGTGPAVGTATASPSVQNDGQAGNITDGIVNSGRDAGTGHGNGKSVYRYPHGCRCWPSAW